jgi:hypothetical protein
MGTSQALTATSLLHRPASWLMPLSIFIVISKLPAELKVRPQAARNLFYDSILTPLLLHPTLQ